jgi:phospholipid/cholesterol/gamma-HCH transport system substrate-binding protein
LEKSKFNLSNEMKIGLVVIAAIIVAFVGFRIMKDQPVFRQSNVLYTTFDRVDALLPGSVVHVKGLKIGTVKGIEYQVDSDNMLITLNITSTIPIPVGSKAKLVSPEVFGSVTVEIVRSNSAEQAEWESFLEGVTEQGLIDKFSEKGDEAIDKLNVSLTRLNGLMGKLDSSLYSDNRDKIGNTLSSFEKTGKDVQQLIERRKSDIDSMIISMSNAAQNFDELSEGNKAEVDSMLTSLKNASMELETLSKGLNKTTLSLNDILGKINEGTGTFGKMVNDESLYTNLDSLSFNLNELVKNIQKDPKKYLKHMRLVEVF